MARLHLSEYVSDDLNRTAQVFKYTNGQGFVVDFYVDHAVTHTTEYHTEALAESVAEDWCSGQ